MNAIFVTQSVFNSFLHSFGFCLDIFEEVCVFELSAGVDLNALSDGVIESAEDGGLDVEFGPDGFLFWFWADRDDSGLGVLCDLGFEWDNLRFVGWSFGVRLNKSFLGDA